jgi:hypothetical protein
MSCRQFKGIVAQPIIDTIAGMFASDTTEILAFQRVEGNEHELNEMHAELRKIQARLSATEDDDELDSMVKQRKAIKARIEGFEIIPDRFDYAPTGQTVGQRWNGGDDGTKRGMALAVKASWGMALKEHDGHWGIAVGTLAKNGSEDSMSIVDLGNGLCFRR